VDGPGGRLAAYEARTEKALDLLALLTLWIVVVPPWDFGHDVDGIVWTIRIGVSVVYGIDRAIRGVLARRPVRYALTHPVMLVSMAFPPVRLIFSFRLVRSVFRHGQAHPARAGKPDARHLSTIAARRSAFLTALACLIGAQLSSRLPGTGFVSAGVPSSVPGRVRSCSGSCSWRSSR
jgi:hypothetical protein